MTRRFSALGLALVLTLLLGACASVRATGPKTALDRCVDACEVASWRCGHPTFPESCGIEYEACVVDCDQQHDGKL